jgi:hypothetical protein
LDLGLRILDRTAAEIPPLPIRNPNSKIRNSPMALYQIPPNIGKVRVAMFLGGKFAVWNGKHGKHEFRILCRDRKHAEMVAAQINRKQHEGSIEVLG